MLFPSKGRSVLWLVMSLSFAVSLVSTGLLFAADARAQEANASGVTTEAPVGEATPESGAPPVQTTPPASEQTPSTGEEVPPANEQTLPVSEEVGAETQQPQPSGEHEQSPSATEELASSTEPTQPVVEEAPPSSEPTPPLAETPPPSSEPTPVVENPPAAQEPTPPVAEQTPPTSEQTAPVVEEAPVVHEQQTTEKPTGKAGGEASSGGSTNEGSGDSQTPTVASGSDHKEQAAEVLPVSPTPTMAPNTSMAPNISMTTPVVSVLPGESQAAVTAESPTSSARRRARQISRELAAFGASIIATGSISRWLDAPGASSVSSIAFAAITASPAAAIAAGALAHNRDNDSAIASYAPGPGPAPGGAGGGSAAGASSGAACSASFILTSSLLHSAPSVMLQLCVSQPSWRTSFFVLIPERPG